MLPCPMPRRISDKNHSSLLSPRQSPLPTTHHPLSLAVCFHEFPNPSSSLPTETPFCFDRLTNAFSRNAFVFRFIQNAWASPCLASIKKLSALCVSAALQQATCFHGFAAS